MGSRKIKFTVGLFVTGGLSLAIIAIIVLGMSGFMKEGHNFATYFNESVQGLDIDSQVKYRGVSVGRVKSIDIAPDSKLIEVILRIEKEQMKARELFAQLKPVGITGSMFVELDRKGLDDSDASPSLSFVSEYPIIDSKPSDISKILRGIDDVLEKVNDLDTKGISNKIKITLDNINTMINDADIKSVSAGVKSSIENIKAVLSEADKAVATGGTALARIDGIVADEQDNIRQAIESFNTAMGYTKELTETGASMVDRTDESLDHILRHLLIVSRNLEKASKNLNRVIERLSDKPSLLIFDEPPEPRN